MNYCDPAWKQMQPQPDIDVWVEASYVTPEQTRIEELQNAIATAYSYLDQANERVHGAKEDMRPMAALHFINRAKRILANAIDI